MKHLYLFLLLLLSFTLKTFSQPVLQSATYDAEFDILKLQFDVDLNDGLMNTSGFIELSVDEGTVEYQSITTPFPEVSDTENDNIIEIQLTTPNAVYVEGWSTVATNLEVSLGASVFFDQSSNGNAVVSYTSNVAVAYYTTEPQVLEASYDAETDELTLTFSRALNDASFDTYGSLGFSVDEGSVNTRTLFTPLTESSGTTNDNEIIIDVSSSDATVIEGWANLSTNLELALTTAMVSSLSSASGNILLSYSNNLQIEYIPQSPQVINASYDSETNILHLQFNRSLNNGSLNTYESVTLSKDEGTSSVTLMTPFGISADVANDSNLAILVGASDATVIEGWTNLDNLEVELGSSLIQSSSGYYNLAQTFADNVPVTYIVENPSITNVTYDAETNSIEIRFNRELNDALLDVNASAGLSVDNAATNYIYFDTPLAEISSVANDSIIVIQLSTGTATTIEGWTDLETDLELEITTTMVTSQSGYTNATVNYTDDVQVTYNSANPKLTEAEYDADTNELTLLFDRVLNDANFNSSASIGLSVDNGASSFQYITIPLSDISTTANDSTVVLELTSANAITIEGWSGLEDNLEINLPATLVQSFSGFLNEAVSYSNDFQVTYIAPEPAITNAIFYAEFDLLHLEFNRNLNDTNFKTNGSIYLSVDEGAVYYEWIDTPLNEVSAVANDNIIEIKLQSDEGISVDAMNYESSYNHLDDLEIEISGTLVQSQSGFYNTNYYYSDNIHVEYILGDPLIERATFNAITNVLTIYFDHRVDETTFNVYSNLGLSVDNETSNYLMLSEPLTEIDPETTDSILMIQVNATNAATIESWPDLENKLELEFADEVVDGVNGLENHWYDYSDDIQVEYLTPPTAITDSISELSDTSVSLYGRANANSLSTAVTFKYGISDFSQQLVASQSPLTGTDTTLVSASISSLTPNTAYSFYIEAVNADGNTISDTLSFTTLPADSTMFTGTGLWNDTTHWSAGIPGATSDVIISGTCGVNTNYSCDDITINAGNSLTINQGDTLTYGGTFTINSNEDENGSLLVNGAISGGDVTYNRYLTASNWHLVASPVTGQAISDFSSGYNIATNESKYAIAPYDNSIPGWAHYTSQNIASAGDFSVAKGYEMMLTSAGTLPFTGNLITSDTTITLTTPDSGKKWNLIGNPFTAALNANQNANSTNNFLTVNQTVLETEYQAIYIWDPTADDYITVNQSTPATYIAPGQAFFVYAAESDGDATFSQAMLTNQTGDIFKSGVINYPSITLFAENQDHKKSTHIKYIDGMTTGIDAGYDAARCDAGNNSLAVFTQLVQENTSTAELDIQCLPGNNYDLVIPVGLLSEQSGEVVFSTETTNLPAGTPVYLEDKLTGTTTALHESGSFYQATIAEANESYGRFYIYTKSILTEITDTPVELGLIPQPAYNRIRIIGNTDADCCFSLYDVSGRKLLEKTPDNNNQVSMAGIKTGVYIATLRNNGKTTSKKISWLKN